MKAGEQARFRQALHIAAHRLQRDPQGVGKLFHRGGFARTHFFKQLELAGVGVHGGGLGAWVATDA